MQIPFATTLTLLHVVGITLMRRGFSTEIFVSGGIIMQAGSAVCLGDMSTNTCCPGWNGGVHRTIQLRLP